MGKKEKRIDRNKEKKRRRKGKGMRTGRDEK